MWIANVCTFTMMLPFDWHFFSYATEKNSALLGFCELLIRIVLNKWLR